MAFFYHDDSELNLSIQQKKNHICSCSSSFLLGFVIAQMASNSTSKTTQHYIPLWRNCNLIDTFPFPIRAIVTDVHLLATDVPSFIMVNFTWFVESLSKIGITGQNFFSIDIDKCRLWLKVSKMERQLFSSSSSCYCFNFKPLGQWLKPRSLMDF